MNSLDKENVKDKRLFVLKDDIEYFIEYSENIEKIHQNLIESKVELNKNYGDYKNDVLSKHLITLAFVLFLYVLYKIINKMINKAIIEKQNKNVHDYSRVVSLVFYLSVIFFLFVRYIDDLLYIITFLSVIAAALTIAMREVLMNIIGSIYILFSRVIKPGERIMVQFETKHTIGDIIDISLMKIKLHEINDYSNVKEIKSVGKTTYIPNSYIFTKVFYNYSLKKNGLINDLIELDFDIDNDFKFIEEVIADILKNISINYKLVFSLNTAKNGINGLLSYEVNYKESSNKRGVIIILLMQELKKHDEIKFKSSKKAVKSSDSENE